MPPPARKRMSASQACGKAATPLCTTPQTSQNKHVVGARERRKSFDNDQAMAWRAALVASAAGARQLGENTARRSGDAAPPVRRAWPARALPAHPWPARRRRPAALPPAPGAAARTESPGRSARRSRGGRPPSPSLSIRSAMRSMPKRPSRSEKSAGWMLAEALPTRLSNSAAGALMKRKPRSVNSRGSTRRSVRLSMENRNPRSASAARLSCSIGPMARTALWVNSNTSDGRDRAVGLDEFQQLRKSRIGQGRARRDCRTGRSSRFLSNSRRTT